jgi:hypothetical protein
MRRKEDSSFLQKRSKKLLSVGFRGDSCPRAVSQISKSLFASFSSEKEESSFSGAAQC